MNDALISSDADAIGKPPCEYSHTNCFAKNEQVDLKGRGSACLPSGTYVINATMPLTSNEIEAANRAEVTALLIRAGYRVYRPEADVHGEDMVIRAPEGELRAVQMKARPVVDWKRYGGRNIWMLFPEPAGSKPGRSWFLVPHDEFFAWAKPRHGSAPKWADMWSYPDISADLRGWLEPFSIRPGATSQKG